MNYVVKLENYNGQYVVSSRVVAKELGKEHSKVLRTLEEILEKPNVASLIIPNFYRVSNQKRQYKEYLLTKDGFTLYMFNIQGYQDFKMAYINKFNEMEKALKLPLKTKYVEVVERIEKSELIKLRNMIAMLTQEIDKELKEIQKRIGIIEDCKTHINVYSSVLKQIV